MSSIKDVLPEDPENPTYVKIHSSEPQEFGGGFAEFDTEESAREWRRELIGMSKAFRVSLTLLMHVLGALYMSRHRRAEFLTRQPEDERNGVRINVPLSRIESYSSQKYMIGTKLNIEMSFTPHHYHHADNDSLYSSSGEEDNSDPDAEPEAEVEGEAEDSASSGSSAEEAELYGRTIQLCVLQKPDVWDGLGKLIEQAKEREAATVTKKGRRRQPKVIVDFGALSFVERRLEPQKVEDAKEQAIRHALSLGQVDKIWCKLPLRPAYETYLMFQFNAFP